MRQHIRSRALTDYLSTHPTGVYRISTQERNDDGSSTADDGPRDEHTVPAKTIYIESAFHEKPLPCLSNIMFSHSLGKQAHLPTRLAQSTLEHHKRDDERDEQDEDGRRGLCR
jgi:hypothetical protein